jgi:hypothetical protein
MSEVNIDNIYEMDRTTPLSKQPGFGKALNNDNSVLAF